MASGELQQVSQQCSEYLETKCQTRAAGEWRWTIRAGVATWVDTDRDLGDILKRADAGLNECKGNRRNRVAAIELSDTGGATDRGS